MKMLIIYRVYQFYLKGMGVVLLTGYGAGP